MKLSTLRRLLGIAVVLGACRADVPNPRSTEQPPISPTASTRAPALPAAMPTTAGTRLPLGERLVVESSQRPALAVRSTELARELTQRGVALVRTRQVLAAPIGASYCETVVTGSGLGLSICEFPDSAAASAGQARSHALFDALMPGRTLVENGNTLLTLNGTEGASALNEAALARDLFASLSPTSAR